MSAPLHYHIHQPDASAPVLVLIHGLFGDADNLAVIRRHFEHTHRVISIDLPDHGQSPGTEHFTLEDCVSGVLEVLAQEHVSRAAILGHSLGGKVAMLLALTHPQVVSSLIVADIAPVRYDPRHNNVIAGLRGVDLATVSTRQDADRQLALHIEEPGVRQFLLKSLYQAEPGQWQWRFNIENLADSYEDIRSFPTLTAQFDGPVLFIKGGRSDYLDAKYRDSVVRYFPNAKARVIEHAGHWLHAEDPKQFNHLAERFLASK